MIKRFWKIVDTIIDTILAVGTLGIVVMCMSEIIARNLFRTSIPWSGEAARYLFVYVVFIGAFVLTRDRSFICMDILKTKVRARFLFYYNLLLDILVVLFAAVMLVSGYRLAVENRMQVSAAMGLPKNLVYAVMPVSGFLIIVYSLRNMVEDVSARRKKGGEL